MNNNNPQTNGGSLLKRGYKFDPECFRTTYRLRLGHNLLAHLGVVPTYPQHDENCILSPGQESRRGGADIYSFTCMCGVGHNPQPTWPEWVTGQTFDLAYQLACEVQTEQGVYNRLSAQAHRKAEKG